MNKVLPYTATKTCPLPKLYPVASADCRKQIFTPDMVFASSNTGLKRRENQDSFAYTVSPDGKSMLLMVADGIGGNESGDLASRFTVECILRDYLSFLRKGGQTIPGFLKGTITLTNSALQNLNLNFNVQHSMGTTVAILILTENRAYIAHAGDSRIYRLRKGELTQLTCDHTVVNELIRRGELAAEDAPAHPYAHVICQAIGVQQNVQADYLEMEHLPGDRYLVCSDGVMLHLPDQSIRNLLAAAKNAQDAVRNLVTLALRGGGGDNITALCAFTRPAVK